MNSCMVAHASQAEFDLARSDWFRGLEARRLEREEQERKRKEGEKFWREWWDLPPNQKEESKARDAKQ